MGSGRLALWAAVLMTGLCLCGGTAHGIDVTVDENTQYQTIDGWGTCLYPNEHSDSDSCYLWSSWRSAYLDAGHNILRLNVEPNVLMGAGGNLGTPFVDLTGDLASDAAKFNFEFSRFRYSDDLAVWLSQNALEPERVKINPSVWSPPHWSKAPTGGDISGSCTPVILYCDTCDTAGGTWDDGTYGWNAYPYNANYMAAMVYGFAQHSGVPVYSLTIQNEAGYEQAFNSCTLFHEAKSAGCGGTTTNYNVYANALKAVKDKFAQHSELSGVRIMGPHHANLNESPSNPYGLLTQTSAIQAVKDHSDASLIGFLDIYTHNYSAPTAERAEMFAGHWLGTDNVSADWAAWSYPQTMHDGVAADGKAIWNSEFGGHGTDWAGALDMALDMQTHLVRGHESAIIYWQFADPDLSQHCLVSESQLSNPTQSPKYCAWKQFTRYIRPGARRVGATFDANGWPVYGGGHALDDDNALSVSAYVHSGDGTVTIVLVNVRADQYSLDIDVPSNPSVGTFQQFRSRSGENFVQLSNVSVSGGVASVTVPGQSVVTLFGQGATGNNPPVANNDSYSTDQDVTLNVSSPGVLGNDTDADSDPLTAVKVSDPSHGSVTLSSNGSFAYTPDSGYTGSDSFTYKANDGTDDSNTATVSISVVGDAPPAAPTGLTATPGDGQVSLDWDDNSEPDLANYRVYRSTTSGSGYGQIAGPSSSAYTDGGVTNGTTYYYVVTAVDAGSNESGYSGEASATPVSAGAGTGLQGEYYDNMDFTSLAVTRVDPTVGFDWGDGSPDASMGADTFSVRWTGKVEPLYSETYTFRTHTDDGVRLWVDGQLVVENWTDHGPTSDTGTISLTAGVQYDIQLDFYENGGGAVCQLYWSSASQTEEIVPQSQLYEPAGDATPPAAPTGLGAAAGDGQVALDWNDNGEPDLSGYRVYRSTTSGSGYSQIASPSASAYTDTGLTNGTAYYYVVTAVDTSSNESGYSNEASATPQAGGAPGELLTWDFVGEGGAPSSTADAFGTNVSTSAPSGVASVGPGLSPIDYLSNGLTATQSTAMTLAEALTGEDYFMWSIAPTTGNSMTLARVEIRPVSQNRTRTFVLFSSVGGFSEGSQVGSFDESANMNAPIHTVNLSGHDNLSGQVEFRLYVYGYTDVYESVGMGNGDGYDLMVYGSTTGGGDTTPPAAPTGLSATAVSTSQVDLDWNDNTEPDLSGYRAYRSTTSGSGYSQVAGPSSSAYSDTGLSASTTYYYVVTAVDTSSNESGYSSEASATTDTPPDTTPPDPPTGLSATAGEGQVTLDWNNNTEPDLDGYRVYRSTTSGSGYSQIASPGSSAYTDSGVTNGTTYYYVVTAYDTSANESGYSNEASATPQDVTAPAAPTGLSATAGDGSVALDWNNNSEGDLDGYRVYRSTTSGGGYSQMADVSSSAHTDTGLTNGTTYYYVVTAYDTSDNQSGYSNEASATPQTGPAAFLQDGGADGIVCFEAENYDANTAQGSHTWTQVTSPSGYSGSAAMASQPDSGTNNNTGYAANSPRLDFQVNFVKTGTHYVWVRGYGPDGSGDSCHAGIDGAESAASDRLNSFTTSYAWHKDTMDAVDATVNVSSTGVHTVNVWMREDGFICDKVLLTVSSGYTPTGTGPAESPRGGGDTTPPGPPTGLSATAGEGQVSLDWNNNTEPDLDGYRVYRSTTSGSGYSQIASPGSSAYTDSGVTNGTTYYYVVTAYDTSNNESGYSSEVSATPQSTGLPAPWVGADVGAIGQAGSATYVAGTFTIDGGGADIWGTADEFHFVYQTLSGDGEVQARVAGVENTNSWAKAGVMIRAALTGGSTHAMAVVTPGNGVAFQRRTSTDGSSTHTAGSSSTAPRWVRVVRSGSTFTGYESSDGSGWTEIGSATISMGTDVYVGLCVTSHDDSTLCTSQIGSVTVSGGGPDVTPPAAPTGLDASAGDGQVSLDWNDNGEGDLDGYRVYRSTTSGSGYGQIADVSSSAHTDTGVTNGTTYYYVVTAYDTSDNESGYSGETSATPTGGGGGSGTILREWWTDISGTSVPDLTGSANYPDSPSGSDEPTSFEAPTDWADNYGTRMRGYVHPPATGSYTLYIASDDSSELWLSTDDSPANAALIANVDGWTSSREWTKYTSQTSSAVSLTAGQQYYVEALQKEGGGGDNLAVAWTGPGIASITVIDGQYLSPWVSTGNQAPVASFTASPTSGDAPLEVTFDGSGSYDPDGYIYSYDWDFGDGATDNGINPVHTYTSPDTYTVTLTVSDNEWATDSTTDTITVTGGDVTPPAAPTGLTATAGDGTVSLDWADNGEGDLDSYRVYRSTTSGSGYGQVASGLTTSAHTDTGLTNGTRYYYVVTAVDTSANESTYSAEASATPSSGLADAVVRQTLTAPSIDGSVDAVWSDTSSYAIDTVINGTVSSTSDLSGTWRGLWNSSNLFVLVEATDDVVQSDSANAWDDDSVELYIDADNSKGVGYDGVNDFQYVFKWNDGTVYLGTSSATNTAGIVFDMAAVSGGYVFEVSVPWTTLGVTPSTGNLIGIDVHVNDDDDNGSRDGKKAWYATADNSWSDPSTFGTGELFAAGGGDTEPPAAPTGLSASAAGDTQINLDWSDNGEGDLSSYRVYRATSSGGPYSLVASGVGASNYSDGGLAGATTYYYVVTAVDTSSNESNYSAEASATTSSDTTPPASPSNLNAFAGDGSVSLNWDDNTEGDLDGYRVYRSTTSGSGYSQIASPSASAHTDTGVSNGTTYYYVVTAVDTNSNESGYSNEASATPQAGGQISGLLVYHIGNSVTDTIQYGDFDALCESQGKTHAWGRHMIPGAPLEWIYDHPADGFQEAPYGYYPNALPNYAFDCVVAQPYDRSVSSDIYYGGLFMDLALQGNSQCQFYIKAFWPRQNYDGWGMDWVGQWTAGTSTNTSKLFFEAVADGITAEHSSAKPVLIVPTGEVMYALHQKAQLGQVPGISTAWDFYADGVHLNDSGSYLDACTHFATLYKESPLNLPTTGYDVPSDLAAVIRQTVWEVVPDYAYSGVTD